ncbi:MAG: hypothetical protein OER78_08585, partial [Nitrosopumilus sp.]|nr:hypothetical protein [Nitrosopumilus sp.]
MKKKFGLVGIPILVAFLIVGATGNIQFLPDLNTETQTISEVQTQIVPEVNIQQPQIAEAEEQPVKEYTLIIEQTDIQIS